MKRELLPLLIASDQFAPTVETEPLDRIRMQKAVFLLQKRGAPKWRDLFKFTPYDWGPFSAELSNTVSHLLQEELLEKRPVEQRRYSRYVTTRSGETAVKQALATLSDNERAFIRSIREFVTTRSFRRLLSDVYAAYPEYARHSRFSG